MSCCLLAAAGSLTLYSSCCPNDAAQVILIFYMYHVDMKMMGRGAGWQYPQMLAKHFAGRFGLSAATIITASQVMLPCGSTGRCSAVVALLHGLFLLSRNRQSSVCCRGSKAAAR